MATYKFDKGIATGERLLILANDPVFRAAAELLPKQGTVTKKALLPTSGTLVIGAATALYGSDRKADAELKFQWHRLGNGFRRAGVADTVESVNSDHFRNYRDTHLSSEHLESWSKDVMPMWVGAAQHLGLLEKSGSTIPEDENWFDPNQASTIVADGTWIQPASSIGQGSCKCRCNCICNDKCNSKDECKRTDRQDDNGICKGKCFGKDDCACNCKEKPQSRSIHDPRVVKDADALGYNFVVFSVRGPQPRKRIVLRVVHAPGGKEMDVVIPVVTELKEILGDAFRFFAYDGAMDAKHIETLREIGVVPIKKADGVRSQYVWKQYRGKRIGADSKDSATGEMEFDGCRHRVNFTFGMLWGVAMDADGNLVRERTFEHVSLTRRQDGGVYKWELTMRVRCAQIGGWHELVVDPSSSLDVTGIKNPVNLSNVLRVVQLSSELFRHLYGKRNDAEALFNHIKHYLGLGRRAKSYTLMRVELDILMLAFVNNSSVWAEYVPRAKLPRRAA